MAIEITCQCGKLMRFADELEGRRAVCPACRQEIQITSDPIVSIQIADDFRPDVPPAAKQDHQERFWTSPPMLTCGAISCGVLVVAIWFANRGTTVEAPITAEPIDARDIPDRVAKEQPSFAYVANPTKADILQWRSYARYRAENLAELAFRRDESVHSFEAGVADCQPAKPDPRKLSWLWDVKITIAVKYDPGRNVGKTLDRTWTLTGLMRLVPPDNLDMCWFELDDGAGDHSRRHTSTSEWRSDFRRSVKAAKADATKRGANAPKDPEIAGWFNVSVAELREILATPE